jgi:hypothetical protein
LLRAAENLPSQMTAGFSEPSLRANGSARAALESGRFSQKTLRIDIDLELEIALCLWPRREPFA